MSFNEKKRCVLKKFYVKLTSGASSLKTENEKFNARILAELTLVILTIVVIGIISQIKMGVTMQTMLPMLILLGILSLAYALSRSVYYKAGIYILFFFLAIAPFLFVLYNNIINREETYSAYLLFLWSILAISIAGIFLSKKLLYITVGITLLSSTITHFIPTLGNQVTDFSHGIIFFLVSAFLVMITSSFYRESIKRSRIQAARIYETEERFRQLFDATVEGIAVHNEEIIIDVNAAFEDMFEVMLSECIDTSLLDFIESDTREKAQESLYKNYETCEAVGINKSGKSFFVEIVTKPYRYHGRDVKVTAFRDITDRREAEIERARF